MIDDSLLRRAEELLGVAFLAYVLNIPEDRTEMRLRGEIEQLEEPQETALADTLQQMARWEAPDPPEAEPRRPDGSPADRVRRFGWFDKIEGDSLANLMRRAVGGDIPLRPGGLDAAEEALAMAAIDYYPVTLLPPPHPDQPFQGYPVTAHIRVEAFDEAARREDRLARLFEPGQIIYTSSGLGQGGIDPKRLLGCLLSNAEQIVRAFQTPSPDAYVEAARDGLRTVRELCTTGFSTVSTTIGFAYVDVPADLDIQGPRGGRIRAARETDLRVPGVPDATMVLETTSEAGMRIGPGGSDSSFLRGWEQISLDETLVSMAGLLATHLESERALPFTAWRKVFEPLGAYVGSLEPQRTFSVVALTADRVSAVQDWIARLERHYDLHVRVALTRCISAFTDRTNAEDALIDLVIALENLFGGNEGELTFRISTALGWLLGQNAEDRVGIQREAKRVYRARSKVVHGAELGNQEAAESREIAETLLLRALDGLFSRRTDLLADEDRAAKLILDITPVGSD